jgi:WD40 repeat protein
VIKLGGFDNNKIAGHQNKIYALKYHKDNPKILISGGWDDTLLFWDLTSKYK